MPEAVVTFKLTLPQTHTLVDEMIFATTILRDDALAATTVSERDRLKQRADALAKLIDEIKGDK